MFTERTMLLFYLIIFAYIYIPNKRFFLKKKDLNNLIFLMYYPNIVCEHFYLNVPMLKSVLDSVIIILLNAITAFNIVQSELYSAYNLQYSNIMLHYVMLYNSILQV